MTRNLKNFTKFLETKQGQKKQTARKVEKDRSAPDVPSLISPRSHNSLSLAFLSTCPLPQKQPKPTGFPPGSPCRLACYPSSPPPLAVSICRQDRGLPFGSGNLWPRRRRSEPIPAEPGELLPPLVVLWLGSRFRLLLELAFVQPCGFPFAIVSGFFSPWIHSRTRCPSVLNLVVLPGLHLAASLAAESDSLGA